MMNRQEMEEFELRCKNSGLNCDYLISAVKTESMVSWFLAFEAHKAMPTLAQKR